MNIKVSRVYRGEIFPQKDIKLEYEHTNKNRPAWIFIKELPEDIFIISTRVNNTMHHYKKYLSTKIPLFLPTDYTPDEMRRFYNKFSEIYDDHIAKYNIPAARFLLSKLNIKKSVTILDVGGGTGLSSIPFVKAGYKNITLLEYSSKMLSIAKKKKELKKCNFICQDIRKLSLKGDFDVIISVFSFGLHSYFNEKEMHILWKILHRRLKQKGILALIGHEYPPPKILFKRLDGGSIKILKGYNADWFIGIKS